jgi:hypothetical protein
MVYGLFILVALLGLFWLAYRHPRPRRWLLPRRALSVPSVAAVDRQHRHLQAGGLLGATSCEKSKSHFRELLDAGRANEVERELHAGLDFAIRVRALAELGTPEAGRVLERQLSRRLTGDAVEQAWYWVDVAAALRQMKRGESLPAVLRCCDAAAGLPPAAMLAAEAISFPDFASAFKQPSSDVGRAALRALVTTSLGARDGVLDLAGVIRAGLGDSLADAAGEAESVCDPWLAEVVIEAERIFRRLGHWTRFLPADARVLAERQAMRLWAASERRVEWLASAADPLLRRFPDAKPDEQGAILRSACELRADVAKLFPRFPDWRAPWWPDAIRALRWSKSPVVGPVLAGQALRFARRPRHHPRAAVVLAALRGHACHESEQALLAAASMPVQSLRLTAMGSLGHWPPYDPDRVVHLLRSARTDPDASARRAAVVALARLGERAALDEVTSALTSEESVIRVEAATRVAAEELTWLWPDLESAAASGDADNALAASEALERLRERIFGFGG